jgi:hypothetical protein
MRPTAIMMQRTSTTPSMEPSKVAAAPSPKMSSSAPTSARK